MAFFIVFILSFPNSVPFLKKQPQQTATLANISDTKKPVLPSLGC